MRRLLSPDGAMSNKSGQGPPDLSMLRLLLGETGFEGLLNLKPKRLRRHYVIGDLFFVLGC
jgi:hypothetical protein